MRVLHFEFSDFFRRIIHDMSTRLGFDYYGTSYGDDLFKALAKQDFDVIITGMELGDITAEKLIENLKASKYQNIPVIILTSSEIENIHKRLRQLEFNDLILKENLNIDVYKKCILRFEKSSQNSHTSCLLMKKSDCYSLVYDLLQHIALVFI